ncbi:hypothetical protein BJF96_g573 [Verticillium dahliae]|uniref:Mitochondrial division protein 1 n=1 Tax=Verticillium dahliae TaxID=27337 RepID=A0AA44WRR3_VERDA|nr:hypothetical protein BJF96_g573 [Verticillium dahliae]
MPSAWSALKSKFKRRSGQTSPPQPALIISETPSQPPSHGPEISPQSLQERLWNQAYDDLKANESKTVEAYEKVLTCELKGGDPASIGFATQENEIEQTRKGRWGQMEQVVRAGLERTAKEAAIKQGIQDGMQAVCAVKGIVDKAVQASPEAAVAWVGVCFALEILSNPITEAGINRQGLTYVVSRTDWYWNLAGLLLDENRSETSSAGLRYQLEKHVAQLYQKLLLYQMKSACLNYRNRGAVFLRDMLRLDNWDGSLDEIRNAEDAVRRDSEQYNTEQIRSHLQAIAIAAGSQEMKLQDIYLAIQDEKKQQCLQDLRVTDPRDDKARIESTKGGLREDSYRWILDHPDFIGWRDGPQNQLLWIKGDPGKGKTMLLCGIIDQLNSTPTKAGQPAYFFCQGTDARLNNAAAVLRSLIYFLIIQNPPLISYVQDQYDYAGKLLFEDANAWVALSRMLSRMLDDTILEDKILIVDALDECVTDLQRLLKFIYESSSSSRAKWVVSSRNRPEIEQQLKLGGLGLELSLESRHNAKHVSHAVNAYIDSKVSEIQSLKDHDQESYRVRDILRQKANGTFLWVALVAQELQAANSWDIPQVLEDLPTSLEEVYDRMMNQIQQLKWENPKFCRLVLSAATLAHRPLHLAELSVLSGLPQMISDKEESMGEIVAMCGSFLKVEDNGVYIIHQSAKDYLSGKASSTIFPTGTTAVHHAIFSRSLKGMSKTLRRNIYKIQHPGLPIREIKAPNPDPLAAMRYSCVFWIDHLCASKEELTDDGAVFSFLKDHFLHWLESLSLLGQLSDRVLSIRKLLHVAQLQSNKSPGLVGFLKDAEKFVLGHWSIIDRVPVQAYGSALVFSPTMSEVKIGQWKERLSFVKKVAGIRDRWDAHQQTLEGHDDTVNAVAFSPDGKTLASASGDHMVLLWDATTGAHRQTLKGHSDSVYAIAFSPDGKTLASASRDHTVRLWDAATSAHQQTLKGHSSWVYAIAFSPDDKTLASASGDHMVLLWDATTGAHLQTLEGHSDSVYAIAFSPDGNTLASASRDHTVRLWDATTGAHRQTLKGHSDSVYAIAFSPDGKTLASASGDHTARLWDATTGMHRQTLEGHSGSVRAVAFSPDSKKLASASNDNTVQLWDATTGTHQQTLKGHSSWVYAITFSPDDKALLSADDCTVRLWDAATGKRRQTLETNQYLRSSAFSDEMDYGSLRLSSDSSDICFDQKPSDHAFVVNDEWVTRDGKNLLWLPAEYRASCAAIYGDTVVLGHVSGGVTFLKFDLSQIDTCVS